MTLPRFGAGVVVLGGVLLLGSMTVAIAQQRMGSGHALDASLQMRSGGYNRPTGGANGRPNRSRYTVGSSRSIYTVERGGEMRYNPNNAFNPRGRYRATGYGGMQQYSNARHQRFRYYR